MFHFVGTILPPVNSSPPSAIYAHQWIVSALVQIMAWHRIGAKPLSKPMLGYYELDHYKQTSMKFNRNTKFFIHESLSENIFCETAAILCTGRRVNTITLMTLYRACTISGPALEVLIVSRWTLGSNQMTHYNDIIRMMTSSWFHGANLKLFEHLSHYSTMYVLYQWFNASLQQLNW